MKTEYVRNGVSEQIDNLQELPVELVANWMERFREDQVYYIASLEQQDISVSMGSLWKERAAFLREMLAEADQRMYEEKERYHKVNGDYRR